MKDLKVRIIEHLKKCSTDLVADIEKEFHGENVEQAIVDLLMDGRVERITAPSCTRYKVCEA